MKLETVAPMIALAAAVGIAAAFNNPSWTDEAGTKKALEAAGYTEPKITGYSFTGCGLYASEYGEPWHTKFNAMNSGGKPVSGVACAGFFKGTTLRFD